MRRLNKEEKSIANNPEFMMKANKILDEITSKKFPSLSHKNEFLTDRIKKENLPLSAVWLAEDMRDYK